MSETEQQQHMPQQHPHVDVEPDIPTSRPTIGRSLVNKPDVFNGDKTKFKSWWRTVFTYIRDASAKNQIADDGERIDICLSYIRGNEVDVWVQNYTEEHFDEDIEEWAVTWRTFKQDLQARFVDSNTARKAQIAIEKLRQGTDTAEDFFQKFETLLTQAGYKKEDAYVVRLLEINVNERIIDQIYSSQFGLPNDYAEWKAAITKIDQLWKRREESRRLAGHAKSGTAQPTPQAQPAKPAPKPWVPKDRHDATGTTFGGAGKPMDLDEAQRKGACFNCHEVGHISRNCPKKRPQQVRGLWMAMTEDDRKKMAEELGFVKPQQ